MELPFKKGMFFPVPPSSDDYSPISGLHSRIDPIRLSQDSNLSYDKVSRLLSADFLVEGRRRADLSECLADVCLAIKAFNKSGHENYTVSANLALRKRQSDYRLLVQLRVLGKNSSKVDLESMASYINQAASEIFKSTKRNELLKIRKLKLQGSGRDVSIKADLIIPSTSPRQHPSDQESNFLDYLCGHVAIAEYRNYWLSPNGDLGLCFHVDSNDKFAIDGINLKNIEHLNYSLLINTDELCANGYSIGRHLFVCTTQLRPREFDRFHSIDHYVVLGNICSEIQRSLLAASGGYRWKLADGIWRGVTLNFAS